MKTISNLPYGAIELKKQIKSSTIQGFALCMMFFTVLGIFTVYFNSIDNLNNPVEGIVRIGSTSIIDYKVSEQIVSNTEENKGKLSKSSDNTLFTSEELTQILIPVEKLPNIELDDLKNKLLAVSDTNANGNNGKLNTSENNSNNEIKNPEQIVRKDFEKEYNTIQVQKVPSIDYDKLTKSIIYPKLAKEMGIQGTVNVAALIDKKGKLIKSYIYNTTNSLLNNEALIAVNNYNDYSPAIQNDITVDCWIIIPIKFKLR